MKYRVKNSAIGHVKIREATPPLNPGELVRILCEHTRKQESNMGFFHGSTLDGLIKIVFTCFQIASYCGDSHNFPPFHGTSV
jgi:hypothetical protein